MTATGDVVGMFRCKVHDCHNRVVKRGTVCTETRGGRRRAARPSTPEQHAAYRNGLCVGLCGREYLIGPRCADCYSTYLAGAA